MALWHLLFNVNRQFPFWRISACCWHKWWSQAACFPWADVDDITKNSVATRIYQLTVLTFKNKAIVLILTAVVSREIYIKILDPSADHLSFHFLSKTTLTWQIQSFCVWLKWTSNKALSWINENRKESHWGEILDVNPCSNDVLVTDHIVNTMG